MELLAKIVSGIYFHHECLKVWNINTDILTFFLEYSRTQDGRLKTLSCEIYQLNVSSIVLKIVTLFCIIWACLRPAQYFC